MCGGKKIEIVALILVIFTWALVATWEDDEVLMSTHEYCSMVQLWHENQELAPEIRPGWPPYQGEEQCHGKE